jgi:hypothetical protein
MNEPWPGYDGQTPEQLTEELQSRLAALLKPAIELAGRVSAYEREQHPVHQNVVEFANYVRNHFAFGPGGSLTPPPSAGGPPWPGYDGGDFDDVAQKLLEEVSRDLLDVRSLLDEVIDYETTHAKRQELLDGLHYLYAHFALGGGGWVVP